LKAVQGPTEGGGKVMEWITDAQSAATVQVWATRIARAGGALYLVGGAVRDRLLGQSSEDLDFCVTGVAEGSLPDVMPEAFATGKTFPVFRARLGDSFAELAMARTEVKTGAGHRGFVVKAARDVTIEEDLRRRDLTINALAVQMQTGELIDPYGGERDLEAGVIRAVSEAFAEDPLRVYRTARFAAQLGFSIADATTAQMASLRDELPLLAAERVFGELRKALSSAQPSLFFEALRKADALAAHFAELHALIGVKQSAAQHPEGDAYRHTLQVVDVAARHKRSLVERFAALTHDLGKGLTPRTMWPAHHGHELAGVLQVNALSTRLRVPSHWRRGAAFAAENHSLLHNWQCLQPGMIVDLYAKAQRNPLGVEGFAAVCEADYCGHDRVIERCLDTEDWLKLGWELEEHVSGAALLARRKPDDPPVDGRKLGELLRRLRMDYVKAYLSHREGEPD